ncbi:MAG TPA: helix-turn-helix transcriptional regulator, partial [Actinomycetes bacterium]
PPGRAPREPSRRWSPTAAGGRPRRWSPRARRRPRPPSRPGPPTPSRSGWARGRSSRSSSGWRSARLDLAPPGQPAEETSGLAELLGLTPREAEVLGLVARGYTNRQIAAALVISVKTASVHVSHILDKLDARNRVEAAAIAHRLT